MLGFWSLLMSKILSLSFSPHIDIKQVLCARSCPRCWRGGRSRIDATLHVGGIELALSGGGVDKQQTQLVNIVLEGGVFWMKTAG